MERIQLRLPKPLDKPRINPYCSDMAEHADPKAVPGKRPGRRKYPWHQWTDGEWWRLAAGTDYTLETTRFRSCAYNFARRNGYKLRTKQVEGGLFLQFVPKGESK